MAEKHGYEQTPVESLRQLLQGEPYNLSEQDLYDEEGKLLTKGVLVEKILALNESMQTDDAPVEMPDPDEPCDDIFDGAEEENSEDDVGPESDPDAEPEEEEIPPLYTDEGWCDYVMRQFDDTELDNGKPICEGLRRVVQKLLGPIVDNRITYTNPPTSENRYLATVARRVEVRVENSCHPMVGNSIMAEEIADAGRMNTDHPYCNHPSATASTRAEARAFRKLLGLVRIISADEESEAAEQDHSEDFDPTKPISEQQINVIDLLCKRLNLSVLSFINAGASGRNYKYIEQVPLSAANTMIQYLNRVQQGSKSKPNGVPSYDNQWRSVNEQAMSKELGE